MQNLSANIPWKDLLMATLVFALSQLLVILWQFIDSFTIVHTLQSHGLHFKEAIMQKGIYLSWCFIYTNGFNCYDNF